jgi:MerR family copper efflux transcriptional regulator
MVRENRKEPGMNIGDVSTRSGLPTKTIRYYEDIGFIKPKRGANGYRTFGDKDLHKLAFLGRARALGFSIENCRALLALYEDQSRASSDVKRIAKQHLKQIEAKIADLKSMQDTLSHLVKECAGDQRPDCPILEDLGHVFLAQA